MQKLLAANWKMHKTRAEAHELAANLAAGLKTNPARYAESEIVLFPPFTALADVHEVQMQSAAPFALGAQNFYPAEKGAFTGEISPEMLKDTGCTWLLAGHSERRHILGETCALVGKKTAFAIAHGFSVILCIGETLEERELGMLENVLCRQIDDGVHDVHDYSHMVVAYEPVWAIGTGKVASLEEIRSVHAFVRKHLHSCCGDAGDTIRILYGGSVKPENAAEILKTENVDGLLVGGASLQADSFLDILAQNA